MKLMSNLFSSFDPSSSIMSSSWLFILSPIMILSMKSKKSNKPNLWATKSISMVNKELQGITQKMKIKETPLISLTLFVTLVSMNLWSLIPSSFTPTAQISINLPIAILMWTPSLMFSLVKKSKNTLCHLVPTGTPTPLMPLMVIIELTSNLIRPMTLAIRLTANMVAGHILIALTEEFIMSGSSPLIVSFFSMSTLTILETGVAVIQAFIFSILITLFSSENH